MSTPESDPDAGAGVRRAVALCVGALAVSIAAVLWSKLAVWATVLVVIAFAAMPRLVGRRRTWAHVAFAGAGILVAASLARFVVREAMPGVVEAGQRASGRMAVSRLREVVFNQDMMRKNGYVDPDSDGIGSAGLIVELTGLQPLRGSSRLPNPLMPRARGGVSLTSAGPALRVDGYLILVCLPREGGGWTASPGVPVAEERAEREYVAYAWPEAESHGLVGAFAVDAAERIWAYRVERRADGALPYVGGEKSPSCDALETAPREWPVWKGKRARESLPGDTAPGR